MTDVVVTQQDMYKLLVKIDHAVASLSAQHDQQARQIADHETRIRSIEAEEDLGRRLAVIESHVAELQRKVWAIPSAATVIALAAIVISFIRT